MDSVNRVCTVDQGTNYSDHGVGMEGARCDGQERCNEGDVCPLAGVPVPNEASKENQIRKEHREDNSKRRYKARVTKGGIARHKAIATKDDGHDSNDNTWHNKRAEVGCKGAGGWEEEWVDGKQ